MDSAQMHFFGDELLKEGFFTSRKERAAARQRVLDRYSALYEDFDGGHGPGHRDDVVRTSRMLAEKYAPRKVELAEAAAILHDVGLSVDRDRHEHHAVDLLKKDKDFRKAWGFFDRRALLHAVREHRNSTGRPRSVLAKIVSDADRTPGSGATSPMARAMAYGRANFPDRSEEEQLLRAGKHLASKYPVDGSVRTYMPETADLLRAGYDPVSAASAAGDVDALRALAKVAGFVQGDGEEWVKTAAQAKTSSDTFWAGFRDELEKLAGVELNLHGYSRDPTVTPEIQKQLS